MVENANSEWRVANGVLNLYSLLATRHSHSLPLPHVRQERGEQSDRRQERTDLIDEADRGVVGELAKCGGAQPADAEGHTEEHTGDHAEAMRHQFLREHDNRRSGRRQYEPDQDREHRARMQADMRQGQRERQRTEHGNPEHDLAAETVAERTAEEGANSVGGEEDEKIELGRLG